MQQRSNPWFLEDPELYLTGRMFGNELFHYDLIGIFSSTKKSDYLFSEEMTLRYKIQLKILQFLFEKKQLFETDRQLISTSIVVPTFLGLPLKLSLDGIFSGKFDIKMNFAIPLAEFEGRDVNGNSITFEIKPRFPY